MKLNLTEEVQEDSNLDTVCNVYIDMYWYVTCYLNVFKFAHVWISRQFDPCTKTKSEIKSEI